MKKAEPLDPPPEGRPQARSRGSDFFFRVSGSKIRPFLVPRGFRGVKTYHAVPGAGFIDGRVDRLLLALGTNVRPGELDDLLPGCKLDAERLAAALAAQGPEARVHRSIFSPRINRRKIC
ncbi:MAG TPA: hypothetical protein VL754_19160 [Verrucomicrobiae bacterium]|jgi:hypothetical protein|nr:hypothetical protein [Verrucomicrobiae bacterium]